MDSSLAPAESAESVTSGIGHHQHKITLKLAWTTAVAYISVFQFGFHLAELNAPSRDISCHSIWQGPFDSYKDTFWFRHGLKKCIPMTEGDISTATTMLTVGGLIACVISGSGTISAMVGRRSLCIIDSLLFLVGSVLMTLSNSVWQLNLGRFISGLGAGLSLVVTPILINEITPINHRGLLGSGLQFAIGFGICCAQALALKFANAQEWRNIFLVAAITALIQFIALFSIHESPKWILLNTGDTRRASTILDDFRSNKRHIKKEINYWRKLSNIMYKQEDASTEETPLISSEDRSVRLNRSSTSTSSIHLSSYEFFTLSQYRKQMRAVFIVMSAQQLCGMNAITFYSVSILSRLLPDGQNPIILSCCISLTQVIMGMVVSPLVDKIGRKFLLLISILVMAVSCFSISLSSIYHLDIITSAFIFIFVIGYSIGLGPIPNILIPELVSYEIVGAAQSLGSCVNWTSNIILACSFPAIADYLQDYVFMVFFGVTIYYFFAILKFVPETHGHAKDEAIE